MCLIGIRLHCCMLILCCPLWVPLHRENVHGSILPYRGFPLEGTKMGNTSQNTCHKYLENLRIVNFKVGRALEA